MAFIIAFSPLWLGGARIWPLTIISLVSYALIFIWLWRANNSCEYKFKRTAIDIPIFLFAALAVISCFFSIYKHDSVYVLIKLFSYIGVYYLVVNEFDMRMIKSVLYVAIAIGGALSAYGLLQYFNLLGHSWWDPARFMAATFVNHNHFSGYLELMIPAAACVIIKKPGLPAVLAFIVMTTAFILAQSRGAWISMGISFLAMVYILAKKRGVGIKNAAVLWLLVISVLSLAYSGRDLISERMSGPVPAGSTDDSFAIRLRIWQGALDMIRHNPLTGTGIGTFTRGFPRYRPDGLGGLANFAHNDYLETACGMGVPALIVMLWLIVTVIITGMKQYGPDLYRLGCVIGILSLSLHALSDFNFHIPANMLLFTVYLAIIMKGEL